MIEFIEDDDYGYKNRTIKNASADVTLAIASDFSTAGERLTKSSVINQNNLYIPINIYAFESREAINDAVNIIVDRINALGKSEITINIAGNGIYTLKDSFLLNQKSVDYFIYVLLNGVKNRLDAVKITMIRSGGQSGADEAGAKAGLKLGISTLVLSPKGWRYRNELSQDIMSEELFKKRFEII